MKNEDERVDKHKSTFQNPPKDDENRYVLEVMNDKSVLVVLS